MRSAAATLRPKPNKAPAPIGVLRLRAWARAYLWAAGEIENITTAVDPLQTFSVESGLVAEIGQDAVQKILSDAFAPYRKAEKLSAGEDSPPFARATPASRPTPQTTIEAIMWCVRERDLQALHEPENIERLSRCDNAAIAEIDARLLRIKALAAREERKQVRKAKWERRKRIASGLPLLTDAELENL